MLVHAAEVVGAGEELLGVALGRPAAPRPRTSGLGGGRPGMRPAAGARRAPEAHPNCPYFFSRSASVSVNSLGVRNLRSVRRSSRFLPRREEPA